MSAGHCINKHRWSSADHPGNLADGKSSSNPSVVHLDTCLHLNVVDGDGNSMKNDMRGEGGKHLDESESSTSAFDKSDKKYTAFLELVEPKYSVVGSSCGKEQQLVDGGNNVIPEANYFHQSVNESSSQSTLLPTPVKLVSSMKGTREKQGMSPKKLSVTWAPDVYDPIPTSVSHVPNNNQHRRRDGKKYRKNKKKGGAGKSDASRNNDKKQPKKKKKKNGGTNNCKPMPDDSLVVGISEPQSSILDFDGATLNSSCGKSFLMTSIDKLHFPVAEAT